MALKQSLTRFFKRGKCDSAAPCTEDVNNPGTPVAPNEAPVYLQDRMQRDHLNFTSTTIRPSVSAADLLKHDKSSGSSLFRSFSTSVTRVKNRAAGALVQKQASNPQFGASRLALDASQNTTLPQKTTTVCGTSAGLDQSDSSALSEPQRPSFPSRAPLQERSIRGNEKNPLPQEQRPRADSLAHTRPEMAHPHRNGKKLFEGLHSDLEPIPKAAKSGEKRKSAIKRRSLHGTKRVSFASEPLSRKSQQQQQQQQQLDPSLASLVLKTSSQRTVMPHRSEKRLSFGSGRRRSALMTIAPSQVDSSVTDETIVETDMIEPENQRFGQQHPTRSGHDPEQPSLSRPCYSDFVRHNTIKRTGYPQVNLHVPSNIRTTMSRRRSLLLVPALRCKIQADQQSHTRRRHQRLQEIPSEALS